MIEPPFSQWVTRPPFETPHLHAHISKIQIQKNCDDVSNSFKKICGHKNFELFKKSLRFKCDSVNCDQNDKSFFNLIKILTALKIGSYGNFYSHKKFRALNKSLRFKCDSVNCDQNDKSFFDLIKILTA